MERIRTRNQGAYVPGFYMRTNVAQTSSKTKIKKANHVFSKKNQQENVVSSRNATSRNIPLDIKEFIDAIGAHIVSNLKATGFSARKGSIPITKKVQAFLIKELGLNKTQWKPIEEAEFDRFEWDKEIFREGDQNDRSICLNLELKLNKEHTNNYFGLNRNNQVVAKNKQHMPKLNFRFARRIQDETEAANLLEASIERSNNENFA